MAFSATFGNGRSGRKVRIVKRRLPTGAAGLSLAAVAVTAVFSLVAWRWWRSGTAPVAPPILLEDAELDWECDNGHPFVSQGQVGGQPCPQCREMSYPVTTYICEVHGTYKVRVQFGKDETGSTKPVLYRVHTGPWTAAGDGPKCPRCELVMTRKYTDPLEGLVRPKRKSSGS